MSKPLTEAQVIASAERVAAPELRNIRTDVEDRSFGLPAALHAMYFGAFLLYLGIMGVGFPHPEMVLPMAIFFLFVVAAFAVPMAWTKIAPERSSRAMRLDTLLAKGIATETGKSSGGDAVAQVLILPILIVGWGIAAVSIAALV
ncbi:hypothetical protein [Sphingomicrobium arenosum]|uniref:hypothetical protein n=1 Tax=Sphingomicrobium arenosum TaxID=2233861 RepID=UPI002240E969|nr:hypothetical protein [Sphingomicrobium arenosum]